jgi:hypothetical protein
VSATSVYFAVATMRCGVYWCLYRDRQTASVTKGCKQTSKAKHVVCLVRVGVVCQLQKKSITGEQTTGMSGWPVHDCTFERPCGP